MSGSRLSKTLTEKVVKVKCDLLSQCGSIRSIIYRWNPANRIASHSSLTFPVTLPPLVQNTISTTRRRRRAVIQSNKRSMNFHPPLRLTFQLFTSPEQPNSMSNFNLILNNTRQNEKSNFPRTFTFMSTWIFHTVPSNERREPLYLFGRIANLCGRYNYANI